VTADERKVLEAQVPEANVAVIPTIHNIAPRVTPVDQRKGLLFVGGFEHPPNADAAVYLIREVMPLVWNLLGDVSVTIIGSSVPPEVEKLASSRVDVRGWVEDLEPLLQSARALVAPVRFGAGVKGKITQGLAAGLPVVTTPVGAEGLGGSDGENMLIGGDTDALAERIVRVVEDDVLWGSLSRGGQELIAGGFSLDVLDERMRELLDHRVLGHPIASGG
jgi:glycosyltransferase involved in cell wall biosynthesis